MCVSSSSIKHMNRSRIEPVGRCELTNVESGVYVKRVHGFMVERKEGVECFGLAFHEGVEASWAE